MDTNQPITNPVNVPASTVPGIFETKIPSTIAYVVGVLLFFMPFVDIKCNNMSLQEVSGIQLATGFTMKKNGADNSFLNDMKMDKTEGATAKSDKKDPNIYALIALALGIIGIILSVTNARAASGAAMVTGIASAGALIGLFIDIKKQVKLDMPDSGGDISKGIEDIGRTVTDKMNISVDFTPWFYIALISFLAAAYFCYKRMSISKA
jgi:hypothetical protein